MSKKRRKRKPWRTRRESESNLNDIRLSINMTWEELGQYVGIHPGNLCALNNGTLSPLYLTDYKGMGRGEIKITVRRICEVLEIPFADIFPRYACGIEHYSEDFLDIALNQDTENEEGLIYERIEPDKIPSIENGFILLGISIALKTLPKRCQTVIILRYWNNWSLGKIGDHIGVGRERVRQIIAQSLRKMRHPSRARHIKHWINETGFSIEDDDKQKSPMRRRYENNLRKCRT